MCCQLYMFLEQIRGMCMRKYARTNNIAKDVWSKMYGHILHVHAPIYKHAMRHDNLYTYIGALTGLDGSHEVRPSVLNNPGNTFIFHKSKIKI